MVNSSDEEIMVSDIDDDDEAVLQVDSILPKEAFIPYKYYNSLQTNLSYKVKVEIDVPPPINNV